MKLYNKYISIFCMAALSLLMISCNDFLEEEPKDKKPAGQYWKTESDAKSAVNGLYYGGAPRLHDTEVDGGWTPKATMWGGVVSGLFVDKRKDRTFTNASEGCNFNIESFDATSLKLWEELYKGVSRSNAVIINVPLMTDVLSESQIKYFVAQGKFFRAYNYFNLVKEFNNVPYVDIIYTSLEGIYVAPSSAADIYKHIEKDLLDAINEGGLAESAFYTNKGYITKSTAETLLAQVYLQWAGAPVNGGNDYYTKAAVMAKKVITDGQHELIQAGGSSDDLKSAFNDIKTTKSSNEIIFAKEFNQAEYNVGNSYVCRSIGAEAFQWGVFKPGGDILYNAYLPCDMLLNSYEVADIRSHEKQFFFRNWDDKDDKGNDKSFVLNNVGNWAWFEENPLKTGKDGNYNMPVFRYAEVLLIAAESYARTGNEVDAKKYLNEVRKRAGLADETASGNDLIQSILTERFHEFVLEFKIWDDIRRTRLYPEDAGMNSGKLKWTAIESAKIQNKPDGSIKTGAIPAYALLWPIPLSEMQANPLLKGHQNPGWD